MIIFSLLGISLLEVPLQLYIKVNSTYPVLIDVGEIY